jgi:hypothetical protein
VEKWDNFILIELHRLFQNCPTEKYTVLVWKGPVFSAKLGRLGRIRSNSRRDFCSCENGQRGPLAEVTNLVSSTVNSSIRPPPQSSQHWRTCGPCGARGQLAPWLALCLLLSLSAPHFICDNRRGNQGDAGAPRAVTTTDSTERVRRSLPYLLHAFSSSRFE